MDDNGKQEVFAAVGDIYYQACWCTYMYVIIYTVVSQMILYFCDNHGTPAVSAPAEFTRKGSLYALAAFY